jgi:hypothetical protein
MVRWGGNLDSGTPMAADGAIAAAEPVPAPPGERAVAPAGRTGYRRRRMTDSSDRKRAVGRRKSPLWSQNAVSPIHLVSST